MDLFEPRARKPAAPSRSLLSHLEVPLRRPLLVLLPILLMPLLVYGASFAVPRLYRSSTLILVEGERMPDSLVRRVDPEAPNRRLVTLRQEILSRTLLEQVANEVRPRGAGTRPLSSVVEGMRDALSVNVRGSDAFTLEYVDPDPVNAMRVVNRLAGLFIEDVERERRAKVEGAADFLDSELKEARAALEEKEETVRRFKESRMGSLPEQTAANLATLQRLQLEQQATSSSLREVRDRMLGLKAGTADSGGQRPALPLAARSELQLPQLRKELEALRTRYTAEHPEVKALEARIRTLEEAALRAPDPATSESADAGLGGEARIEIAQLAIEAGRLQDRLDEIDRRMASFQARVELAPRTEQELATLTRAFELLRTNYTSLLAKKLDVRMAAKLESRWRGETFRIIDEAHVPERPFSPQRSLFALAGLLAGLVLGFGSAFAAESLNHTIKDVRELRGIVNAPVLAEFPDAHFAARR
jgi:polysaccharide chain length determinant protein (PEP-CTERM system associated)